MKTSSNNKTDGSKRPVAENDRTVSASSSPMQHVVSDSPRQLRQQTQLVDVVQRKENKTGLPDKLKSGIENLSGMSMDNVRVHYNSSQPAQLNALAYAQGNNIHVASGQEKHLPHEAWHVVQQRQGRVKPTVQMKRGVPVNDDVKLEKEADVMGAKALGAAVTGKQLQVPQNKGSNSMELVQRVLDFARFHAWGFLSNWGSYTEAENELLRLEHDADEAFEDLTEQQLRLDRVRQIAGELRDIKGMSLRDNEYQPTKRALQRIINALTPEKLNRYALKQLGYPLTPRYVDEATWRAITVGGMPKAVKNKIKRFGSHPATAHHLFSSFISQRWNYHLMEGAGLTLIGENYQDARVGNCLALSQAFAQLLGSYNIDAEVQAVREDAQGRFIAKVDNFIDPTVKGHIYHKGKLLENYYIFSSHYAVWVPDYGIFFDPMSKLKYGSADVLLECELNEISDTKFKPKGKPKTLPFKKGWSINRTGTDCSGGFKLDTVSAPE